MRCNNENYYQPATSDRLEVVTAQTRELAREEIERLGTILEQTRRETDRLAGVLQETQQQMAVLREREQIVAGQLQAWRVIQTAGLVTSEQSSDVTSANSADTATDFSRDIDLPAGTDRQSAIVRETADVVVKLLSEMEQPMHYRAIYQELSARGIAVGGADPAKTLLARFFNDVRLQRVKRGTYAIKRVAGGEDVN